MSFQFTGSSIHPAFLIDFRKTLFLLAEAINTAEQVINKTGPTKQVNKTPYEMWYEKRPNVEDS